MADVGEKLREVEEWLAEIYGSHVVPAWPATEQNVLRLHDIRRQNLQEDRRLAILIAHLRHLQEETDAEADALEKELEERGVHAASLSLDAQKCLRLLADTGLDLGLHSFDMASVTLGILEAEQRKQEDHLRVTEERQLREQLNGLMHEAAQWEAVVADMLEKHHKKAAASKAEEKQLLKTAAFLSQKAKQYTKEADVIKAKLAKPEVRLTPDVYHQAILKKAAELQAAEAELKRLKEENEAFAGLPPDLALAELEVERAIKEADDAEAQFAEQVKAMQECV